MFLSEIKTFHMHYGKVSNCWSRWPRKLAHWEPMIGSPRWKRLHGPLLDLTVFLTLISWTNKSPEQRNVKRSMRHYRSLLWFVMSVVITDGT